MRPHLRLLIVVLFLLVLLGVFHFTGLRSHVDLAFVRDTIQAHKLSGILIFIALFCLGNLIHIPGLIFLAAAVLSFGRLWGGLATYLAALVSCMLTFGVVKLIGGNALREFKNSWATNIFAQLDKRPISSVILLRLMFQTAPTLNYALALSGVRFYQYCLGTVLGLPLPIALYCLFFDYVARSLHLN